MPTLVARRRRSDRSAAAQAPAPPVAPAAGYQTFSPNLAPSLTFLGGGLTILGALGAWIRTARVATEGALPEQASAVVGLSEPHGWALAALGAVVVVGSVTWRLWGLVPKVSVLVASAGSIGLTAWWLVRLDERAAAMAAEASAEPNFVAYSATFGWGAWILLAGAAVLAVAIVAGLLRELDLRRQRR